MKGGSQGLQQLPDGALQLALVSIQQKGQGRQLRCTLGSCSNNETVVTLSHHIPRVVAQRHALMVTLSRHIPRVVAQRHALQPVLPQQAMLVVARRAMDDQ